jgi:hypothetical protein
MAGNLLPWVAHLTPKERWRWLTHTDESEWIKVFDAEELDHRKLAFSGCRL